MADVQVTCITKSARNPTHEGITHMGGHDWKWTRQQVIVSIGGATNTFYALVEGNRRVEILVVDGTYGKILRGFSKEQWTDDLLDMPECP